MPYISVRLAGTLKKGQKAQIVKEFAETIERVTGKPKDSVLTFIDEVAHENIAKGDTLLG
jgi:4-oxalocrotonate tautomerase